MQYNNFIFGMRPECIFINSQLGDRNPLLRGALKTDPQIQSPKSISGLADLRDYDSYPEIYWQLRSDTISQPEDLEGEMLDRDLYKLKQIANLKLSTFDSDVQPDPFRKWRGKAGDPLFCPVRNVPDRRVRAKKATDSAQNTYKMFQRAERGRTSVELEVKSTPIRPAVPNQVGFEKSAEEIPSENDSVTLNLFDPTSARHNSIEARSSPEPKSAVEAPPNTDVRLEPDDHEEEYIHFRKELFRKSPNSKHRREVLKEVMRPAVVSVDLKRDDDDKNCRLDIRRRYPDGVMNLRLDQVAWASSCRKTMSRPQSVTSGDTLKGSPHQENQLQISTSREGDEDKAGCNGCSVSQRSTTCGSTQLNGDGDDEKSVRVVHCRDGSLSYSRRKSSPAPLKAVHLEVFKERVKVNDPGKTSRTTFDPDIPGYKLDLTNYPPSNPRQVCSGPKTPACDTDVRSGDTLVSTSWVRSKHAHTAPKKRTRKANRPSKSANSAFLKITAYV